MEEAWEKSLTVVCFWKERIFYIKLQEASLPSEITPVIYPSLMI